MAKNKTRLRIREIVPYSLKEYLDKKIGRDYRLTFNSYSSAALKMIKLGFTSFSQLDIILKKNKCNRISDIMNTCRSGQLSLFYDCLLAGMGKTFIDRYSDGDEFWTSYWDNRLHTMINNGIEIENYDPLNRPKPD